MLYTVSPNEELTYKKFGYYSADLSPESHQVIIVECNNCHKIIEREKRNLKRKHSCPIIDGNNKRCFRCKEWKDLSSFNKSPKLTGGVSKLCRNCYNKHESVIKCESNRLFRLKHSFIENFNLYLKRRVYQIHNHSKRNGIPCDLDFNYLQELWENQQGLCYYSGLKMESLGKQNGFQAWQSPSLDRKIPSLGYLKGNVVWCCFAVNSFKQTLSELEFKEKVHKIRWQ